MTAQTACNAPAPSKQPNHEALLDAINQVREVLQHISDLKCRLGINTLTPVEPGEKVEQPCNLVSTLNHLPNEICSLTSEIHDVINDIESGLI